MVNTRTKLGKVAFASALTAVGVGVGVFAGWLFKVELLKRIMPGLVAMNPTSALAFILAGTSLALFLWLPTGRDQKSPRLILTARLCALAVLLLGVARLLGVMGGRDLGLDQWLFSSQLDEGHRFPNRMAPNSAFNFLLLGSALLWVDSKNRLVRFWVELAAISASLGSLMAILGYAYHVESFYGLNPFIPMALHTACTFLLLSVALLFSHTDRGLLAVFAGDSAGGAMARRFLPAVIFVPIVFGWFELKGEMAGLYGNELGNGIFALVNMVIFTLLVCLNARSLFKMELRRKKAEAALQREQTELRLLFDLLPAMIFFKDTNNNIIRANQRAADTAGKSVAELEGKSCFETSPLNAAQFYADDLEVIHSARPKLGIIETIRNRDGKEVWLRTDKIPNCDETGKVIGLLVMAQDVTERKQAEEALRESESRFRGFFEQAAVGVAHLDLDGRFLLANQRYCEITGRSAEELLACKFADITHPEDLEKDRVNTQLLLKKSIRNYSTKKRYVHKNGSIVWINLTASLVVDGFGQPKHFVAVAQDITERKRLEEQLINSQKLETVGKLAGGVAHEFNSILTAIIGQAELLLGGLPAGSPLFNNATAINQAADRAATLTRQLLAYGRKQIFQPEILDLNTVLSSMENTLRHLLGSNVNLRLAHAPGLKAVKVDAGQIEQVITNLAINAADSMPHGGKLTLETANITLDEEYVRQFSELLAGEYVMLAITDTGIGMSDEIKARLFEPFFTTKGVGQGVGLGLSTCYGIIKQSGGHIGVYSEPNRGTTFKIYLPQVEPQAKSPLLQLDSPGLPRGTETILLVEDESTMLELSANLLRRLGYTVLAATNGMEALHLLHQRPSGSIHLLLTDLVMPQMNGQELSERVIGLAPQTRLIFTSAYTQQAIVHQRVLNHEAMFLQKPFTPSMLAHIVRDTLDATPPLNLSDINQSVR